MPAYSPSSRPRSTASRSALGGDWDIVLAAFVMAFGVREIVFGMQDRGPYSFAAIREERPR
jgi:hypothetical protein